MQGRRSTIELWARMKKKGVKIAGFFPSKLEKNKGGDPAAGSPTATL